ncbi:zinc ribbon domain-containing protein [Idiomarina seosinensis]|uniref:Zinc ribbon domain-containing protein n=1 Tax=Idiomarina seosinensis TaxID=281739 RepID=A0A432ZFN4_9GAMM|nr:zinc ribbon domain-containing protein [Idiomarina seosinensis]RUO76152.1 zinc ribbon domain-containing protein [Idiomarina seosinensis]
MVFEKCPKCEDQVLDNNYSCPACGYVKSEKAEEKEQHNQPGETNITTENTSKSLQVQGVISIILLAIGVVWFFLTADEYRQRDEINIVALIMFVGGLFWYIITRFRIWREHK